MRARLGWLVVVLSLSAWLCACKDGPGAAPAPDPDGPAGVVLELSGSVTAEGAGDARALAVGDEVTAVDVIETAADSSVVIRLHHNEARWELGAGQRRRVDESLAWRARGGAEASLLAERAGPERTAAAGRQAEPEAADTRATALPAREAAEPVEGMPAAEPVGGMPAEQAAAEAAAPAPEAFIPEKAAEAAPVERARREERATSAAPGAASPERDKSSRAAPARTARRSASPAPGDGLDELKEVSEAPPRPRAEPAAAVRKIALGATVITDASDDASAREAFRAALARRLRAMEACVSQGEGAAQRVRVRLRVAAGGVIQDVVVTGADAHVAGCVQGELGKLRIPALAQGLGGTLQQELSVTPR